MQRITVIMSRNDRIAFIQKLQAQYNISQKNVDAVQNISIGGIAYLVIPITNNNYLTFEFLSDNISRYGNPKLLEKYMKDANGVVVSTQIPELFRPFLKDEFIKFEFNHDTDIAQLVEEIEATPTVNQAIELADIQLEPVASPGVLATLYGLFKLGEKSSAEKLHVQFKSQGGVQDWQSEAVTYDVEIKSGATIKPHGGHGNDDL